MKIVKNFFCLLFAGLLFASTPLFAKKTKIEWQKIEQISRYEVKVRNKLTRSINEYESTGDHVWVEVDFGMYEMKIIAYDRKGRKVSETEWIMMTVMKTYQPELHRVDLSESDRSSVSISGKSFFEKTKIVIRSESGTSVSPQITISSTENIRMRTTLKKGSKYYISVLNPGDYSAEKIAHVFENDNIMLFNDEFQYSRYFAKFFAEFNLGMQNIHRDYDFGKSEDNYWKETYKEGLSSFNLTLGYHIVSWFGVYGGIEYDLYSNQKDIHDEVQVTTHYFIPHGGLFFSYKHKNFVPYIASSIGPSISFLNVESEVSDVSYDSTDLYYSYGGGVKIFVFRQFYLNLFARNGHIDLTDIPLETLSYGIGLGLYF